MDLKLLKEKISISSPKIGEAGKTGEWRVFKPIITKEKCSAYKKNKPVCQICWKFCPDAVIEQGMPPDIDYVFCKGCGVCAEVCPAKAIDMKDER